MSDTLLFIHCDMLAALPQKYPLNICHYGRVSSVSCHLITMIALSFTILYTTQLQGTILFYLGTT